MKTLTLLQPWASLFAAVPDLKRYETRSWDTKYRGPLAIHSSMGKQRESRDFYERLWTKTFFGVSHAAALKAAGLPEDFDALPFGQIIATTSLVNTHGTEVLYWEAGEKITNSLDYFITPQHAIEYIAGDYSAGRFAWLRGPVTPLACPIPAKGRLGLWNCPLL